MIHLFAEKQIFQYLIKFQDPDNQTHYRSISLNEGQGDIVKETEVDQDDNAIIKQVITKQF